MRLVTAAMALTLSATALAPAIADAKKKDPPLALATCDTSLGTVALVEGDVQGWSDYGLGSPRALIAALASESGCFTLHDPSSGEPADFLMTVVAGDQEDVDKSFEMAKGLAAEGILRSGAAGQIVGKVPFGGAVLGMFGGLGGKKKIVAAGIRMVSPVNGLTVAAGAGSVRKTTISFGGSGGWAAGAASTGYGASKDGKMLTEAFVIAFNAVVAQQDALAATARPSVAEADTAPDQAEVIIDTVLYSAPDPEADAVRRLRAGTRITPTGKRDGLFVEAEDGFGSVGWVPVEDLG